MPLSTRAPQTFPAQLRTMKARSIATILGAAFLSLFAVACIAAEEPPTPNAAAAMQLLRNRCFSCHNDEKAKGGLVMTSLEKLQKGGDSGPVLVPGDPEKSPIITALAEDADPHMPPKKQLPPEQIALLTAWVKAGAPWDADALVPKPRPVTLSALPDNYRPVLALAISPDGRRLAAGCGNQLSVFAVSDKTLTLQARVSAHPDPIQSVAWNADGSRIATGAFRRVVVWNAGEISAERILRDGLADRITALRFVGNSPTLAIADGRIGEIGAIHLVNVDTGTDQASWNAHADLIGDLAVSPDGKSIASAGADKLVKIWNLESHKEEARIEAHATQVLALAYNPDGTQLVTGGADQHLKAWDVKTREQVMLLGRHTAAITGAAWVSKGPAIFAVAENGEIARYTDFKAHTGAQSSDSANERKFESSPAGLCSLATGPDGQTVFAGTEDGRILGWNKDGKLVINQAAAQEAAKSTAAQ